MLIAVCPFFGLMILKGPATTTAMSGQPLVDASAICIFRWAALKAAPLSAWGRANAMCSSLNRFFFIDSVLYCGRAMYARVSLRPGTEMALVLPSQVSLAVIEFRQCVYICV